MSCKTCGSAGGFGPWADLFPTWRNIFLFDAIRLDVIRNSRFAMSRRLRSYRDVVGTPGRRRPGCAEVRSVAAGAQEAVGIGGTRPSAGDAGDRQQPHRLASAGPASPAALPSGPGSTRPARNVSRKEPPTCARRTGTPARVSGSST